MKKVLAMVVIFGVASVFMAGCGKKEEPATSLDSLKKVATDAKAGGEKAAADASKSADKAAADAKKAAADVTK
ncbi:MAG: hypothetical protein NT118_13720 [Lentisphaerae bacterium]|nr:hypothetical protein [Lentisphaerota bacterium]